MYSQITAVIIAALAAAPMVSAHGEISVVTGDQGGNGTAFGIMGAVVPGQGPNYKTEIDTTTFWSKAIDTDDDMGYTEKSNGNLELSDLSAAMTLSGTTLPQVSSSGGTISGTIHVVTSDGCGPYSAVIDSTATAKFSQATKAEVTSDIPGTEGNCPDDLSNDSGNQNKFKRALRRGLEKMGVIAKRADNVDKDYSFSISIPSDVSCSGTVSGYSNVCLVKMSNLNANGPFGGTYLVQMGNSTTARVKRTTFSARGADGNLDADLE